MICNDGGSLLKLQGVQVIPYGFKGTERLLSCIRKNACLKILCCRDFVQKSVTVDELPLKAKCRADLIRRSMREIILPFCGKKKRESDRYRAVFGGRNVPSSTFHAIIRGASGVDPKLCPKQIAMTLRHYLKKVPM